MSLGQVADLTDAQLIEIYFRPKDPDPEPDEGESYFDIFRSVWKARGWSDEDIARKFEREFPDEE